MTAGNPFYGFAAILKILESALIVAAASPKRQRKRQRDRPFINTFINNTENTEGTDLLSTPLATCMIQFFANHTQTPFGNTGAMNLRGRFPTRISRPCVSCCRRKAYKYRMTVI